MEKRFKDLEMKVSAAVDVEELTRARNNDLAVPHAGEATRR